MKIIVNPPRGQWETLLRRPYVDNRSVLATVQSVLEEVRGRGDDALRDFASKFDGYIPDNFEVSKEEIEEAANELSPQLKDAILQAKSNIEAFHKVQASEPQVVETMPGIRCWRRSVGIEKVGLYIPGGTAPLFSTVLMLGIPARLAGCREVILCTPCGKDGRVHPAVLFSAQLVGITRVFRIGGAQAVAAMAYGTASIPRVYKIFGPGNQYVTAAKQLVQMEGTAIDMPAGPSEVCVLADDSADASFVASDLLSQAEHGADSQVLLVSTSGELVEKVQAELQTQLAKLPRREMAEKSLGNSTAIVVNDLDEAMALVNEYAAEHLIIACRNAAGLAEKVVNAGSVFIGNYSPESVGDYASGTNHTLPTNGFARAYSGVSLDSFVKKITCQELTKEGLEKIAPTVIAMAEAEGLDAHAEAVRVRVASVHR
jgi:histidinol dehydrogenase